MLVAVTAMNVGDGIVLAAGPLLVASLTRDPFLVSLAFLCEFLPSLLFAPVAGVVVDRVDRRRLTVVMNLARAAIIAVLAGTIVLGWVSIALVLVTLLVLGTTEVFADLASSSLLPRMVPREHLGMANARLQGAFLLTNQLLGPPIGAFLFALGMAFPFVVDAVGFALGAVLLARIAASDVAAPATEGAADGPERLTRAGALRAALADLVEGARWLASHPPMRTLALTIVAFNVTWGAAWAVLVLYAGDRLGMDTVGFGLLTTAMAIGGVVGTTAYGRLERRFSLADIMRFGLVIETFTHLTLALTRSAEVALVTMVFFGAHAFVWGTTATAIRQRAVPDHLQGRIGGLYRVAVNGGVVLGTPIGGLLARAFGITAPFWFAFFGSAVLVAILWREFRHIAHAGDAHSPSEAPGAA